MSHAGGRPDVVDMRNTAEGDRGPPVYPLIILGSRKARKGRKATRHLPHLVGVLPCEHGRLPAGCEEQWGSSERVTSHESSMSARRVGWGIVTNGVSRLQTNESNSTCRSSCHGHTLPPRWSKVCNPTRSGGVYDHHHRVYHGLILSGG